MEDNVYISLSKDKQLHIEDCLGTVKESCSLKEYVLNINYKSFTLKCADFKFLDFQLSKISIRSYKTINNEVMIVVTAWEGSRKPTFEFKIPFRDITVYLETSQNIGDKLLVEKLKELVSDKLVNKYIKSDETFEEEDFLDNLDEFTEDEEDEEW